MFFFTSQETRLRPVVDTFLYSFNAKSQSTRRSAAIQYVRTGVVFSLVDKTSGPVNKWIMLQRDCKISFHVKIKGLFETTSILHD